MQIRQIHVEGFGTLSQCRLSPLGGGLNVIYGNNGSGKTTTLELIRGVLCGFDQARRFRLLPPLNAGNPGGSLTLDVAGNSLNVIRHSRADASDTLAISQHHGSVSAVSELRQAIDSLDEQVIRTLFMVSGYEAVNLTGLVKLALRDNIELQTRVSSAGWITPRLETVQKERKQLFQVAIPQGDLPHLEQTRQKLKGELQRARDNQQRAIADWQQRLSAIARQLEQFRAESHWLKQERHAVESDLTEVQTRLWSSRAVQIEEQETIEQAVAAPPALWKKEIAEIDREIANAQQVLRDLAGSRMELSVTKAGLAGSEVPDAEVTFERQRTALAAMEGQTDRLLKIAARLKSASECLCGTRSSSLEDAAEELRSQIWLLCQELSRQQTAQQQWVLQTQREGVDGCELELTRQIRRLRIRRDELLQRHTSTASEQVAYRTLHESSWCQCEGHAAAACAIHDEPAFVTQPQVIIRTRTEWVSDARPGDAAWELKLKDRIQTLREDRSVCETEIERLERELDRLRCTGPESARDGQVQSLRNELALIEQQLQDGQQRWQALKLTETVLERTRDRLNVEIVPEVIQDASALLSRMTSGRFTGFRFDPQTEEFLVITSTGNDLSPVALSRGTLEQASLSFRLALARAFSRKGHLLPLVLDDVLVDSDEDRSRAAIEVLVERARNHQILFFTCQEHLLELFSESGISILDFPGSVRPLPRQRHAATTVTTPVIAPPENLKPVMESLVSSDPLLDSAVDESEDIEVERLQPDQPYWLGVNSPVSQVPSLGAQMARRLGTIGVRDVTDLIELDLEALEIPLDSLQISAATLRQWQAEARLLCCIPNLTGRDAQVLVLCGIQAPVELSQIDVRELQNRIRKLRNDNQVRLSIPWLAEESNWPEQDTLTGWIRYSRQAQSWRELRESSFRSRRRSSRPTIAGSRERAMMQRDVIPSLHVRLHEEPVPVTTERALRFFLKADSLVVDAPSIGPKMAERLNAIGIFLVSDLLERSAKETAMRLGRREVTTETVTAWQRQSRLMCQIPELRGHDTQVLVACEIYEPETIAKMQPAELFARVEPFVNSRDGQRLLRSAKTPDLQEVTEWIEYARLAPSVRAA